MATYVCRLGTPRGDILTRTMEAASEEELRLRLEREGYHVFSLKRERQGLRLLPRTGRRLKLEPFLHFNQQLAALIQAGLPVLQAITLLHQRQSNQELRDVLGQIEARIREGTPMSEAFAAQGEIFPKLYTASLLAGEKSGDLDGVLNRYIAYTKQMLALKRKVRQAMTYPTILLFALTGLVGVMTGFVIPRFALIYQDFGSQLPVITQVVLQIGTGVQRNLFWLLPTVFGGLAGLFFWRQTERGRAVIDGMILKLPLIGAILRDLTTAQLARSLSTLLRGGVTLVEAYRVATETITNRVLRRAAAKVLPRIQEGESFAESLEHAGWIPPLAVDMIRVGERSGSLKEMLDELASFYDAELEIKLNQLTSLIQPVVLVVMAVLVVFVLLSMYLPLFSFVSTLGGV
ncbi:MAG: type II secretion system F family protein [Acidobacteria bacterium]|nr:MAG: type II secretion system F family protein [Acidobacteriota bacterium]